ncbi:MAG: thiamine diphosphokinase [Chloroflexota bacterium]|nr:MAG: thiamine diphosphokinase [Chloroflexota bacterium]
MTRQALIFANGEIDDGPTVDRALAMGENALHIAADGGLRVARHYGVSLDLIIGDMDSVTESDLRLLATAGVRIERFPPEKNETDLELALLWAAEQGVQWIRIIGGLGGRLDQTLSNIYLLALPALRDRDVALVANRHETRLLLPGETSIHGAEGDTVSLIPVSGVARRIRTTGLYYPLNDEDLLFGPARGVSNVMTADKATVTFTEGVLLLVHTLGKA